MARAAVRIGAGGVGRQAALDREQRANGHDSALTRGRITNGATIAMPKKIASVPSIPAAATIVVVSSAAPSQKAPASPSGIRTAPATARRARSLARSPSVPSTALIGDVRPARRAG